MKGEIRIVLTVSMKKIDGCYWQQVGGEQHPTTVNHMLSFTYNMAYSTYASSLSSTPFVIVVTSLFSIYIFIHSLTSHLIDFISQLLLSSLSNSPSGQLCSTRSFKIEGLQLMLILGTTSSQKSIADKVSPPY